MAKAKMAYEVEPCGLAAFKGAIMVASMRGPEGGSRGAAQFTARVANEAMRAERILMDAEAAAAEGTASYDTLRAAIRDALGLEG